MKLETIKNALKARAATLNVQPQVPTTTIVHDAPVVPEKLVVSQSDTLGVVSAPIVKSKKKVPTKVKQPLLPLIAPAQIQTTSNDDVAKTPDKVTPPISGVFHAGDLIFPTDEQPHLSSGSPARKLAPRKPKDNSSGTAPVVTMPPVVAQTDDIEAIVAKYLKSGRDYDRLPNTTKPTLFKSGAETLAGVFDFRTTAKVINRIENYDKQFVLYEVCVTVVDSDGNIVAEGLGSCNSRERKYLKTDFATNLNTVLKIAKKRAFVDAILTATHASKVFTQDLEDISNAQIFKSDDRDEFSR